MKTYKTPIPLGKAILFLSAVFIFFIFSSPVLGFTVNVAPSSPIEIDDVLAGSTTYKELTLTTDTDSDVRVDLQVTGLTNNWARVDPSNAVISKNKPAKVRLVLDPRNVRQGLYFGYIILTVFSEQPMISSMSWSDSIQFKARVTEDFTVGAMLTDITVFDMSEAENLRVEGLVTNTGNSMIYPIITVDILPSDDGSSVFHHQMQGVGLSHGENSIVLLDQPTNLKPGEYTAKIELSADDLTFQRQLIRFNVAQAGIQRGIIRDLDATQFTDGAQEKINIAGSFMNTGAAQSRVRFITVIYQDGVAVQRLQSEERIVLPDIVETFSVVFVPLESGNYTIKAYFEHDNQITPEKELNIFLGTTSSVELGASWILVFIMLLVLVTVVFWFRREHTIREAREKRDEDLHGKKTVHKS